MNKLVYTAALLFGLTQAAGCIITTSDDTDGAFDVSWTLEGGCGSATTAAVHVFGAGSSTLLATELFNCSDGGGITGLYEHGSYDVFVELTDDGQTIRYAASLLTTVTLGSDLQGVNFAFPTDGGFFTLTWDITDGGAASDCAGVGGDGISVLSTIVGTMTAVDDVFNCTDTGATTDKLAIADYTVSVSLLDAGDLALLVADPISESIDFGNDIKDLGNFTFAF